MAKSDQMRDNCPRLSRGVTVVEALRRIETIMAYIHVIPPEDAEGALARQYQAAQGRAGRIWNIIRIMGQNPAVLQASMTLYGSIMHGPSPLTRVQREMIAVVVSQTNDCHY